MAFCRDSAELNCRLISLSCYLLNSKDELCREVLSKAEAHVQLHDYTLRS